MSQATGYAKVECRAAATGIVTKIGNRRFHAIGSTSYLGKVNHASTRTIQRMTGITRTSALTMRNGFTCSNGRVL